MVYKCNVPDNWTVEPGVFYLGNKYHPCAVLVPLDDELGQTILRHVVDMGVAIAGFCKTANIGLEKVVCNILANPNIRYVIVAGHENPGHKSGKAIVMLHRYGVDPKTRRILCGPDTPCKDIPTGYLPNVSLEAIERFRKQVQVLDLIVDGKEVTDENVLELTCKAVYATTQEPKNKIVMRIKGQTYELFDPGAFDKKPYRETVLDKLFKDFITYDTLVRSIFVSDLENLRSFLFRELKNKEMLINVNIVIVGANVSFERLYECSLRSVRIEKFEKYTMTHIEISGNLEILNITISGECDVDHLFRILDRVYSPDIIIVVQCPILRARSR